MTERSKVVVSSTIVFVLGGSNPPQVKFCIGVYVLFYGEPELHSDLRLYSYRS